MNHPTALFFLLFALPISAADQIVTSNADAGAGSLRQAIIDVGSGENITFGPSLDGDTITLSGQLVVNKNLTIDASTLPHGVIIDADGPTTSSRALRISNSATAGLNRLTLTNGDVTGSSGSGGAVEVQLGATLTMTDSTISGNRAHYGGGLANSGTLILNNCTVSGNQTDFQDGGGIHNFQGTVTLNNVTVTGNHAGDKGGGIINYQGSMSLYHVTLAGNTAAVSGGGLRNDGTLHSDNSILTDPITGSINSGSNNLTSGDPMLADLGRYGGPTETMRPLPGSPVINAGTATSPLSTDQRGYPRLFGNAVDIGACEHQGIIFVDQGVVGGDGSSWANAYDDLQEALTAATAGTEIHLAQGTYLPSIERISGLPHSVSFTLDQDLLIFGGFPSGGGTRDPDLYPSILSGDLNQDDAPFFGNRADNAFHVINIDDSDDNTFQNILIDGITVMGGNADPVSSITGVNDFGGGIHSSENLTLNQVVFTQNRACESGGAMLIENGNCMLTNCSFSGNLAINGGGGGICNNQSSTTLINCSFSGNTTIESGGGGIFNDLSSPTITNCSFSGNSSQSTGGGGIYNRSSSPTITNCSFSGNSSTNYGGGIFNDNSSPTVTNCSFSSNSGLDGGGVSNIESSATFPTFSFSSNSTIARGGGMHNLLSSPTLTNCSFSGNFAPFHGGGIYNYDSSPILTNCLIWNNEDNSGVGSAESSIYNYDSNAGSNPTYNYCLIQGHAPGGTNFDGTLPANDPLFVLSPDPTNAPTTNGDLRLRPVSPAIDVGLNAANSTTTDPHGSPRFVGNIDLGAYEYSPTAGPPYVTGLTLATADTANATTLEFSVTFTEAVTGFNDASDVEITTTGSASYSGFTITPISATQYTITLSGVFGEGDFALTVGPSSDAIDAAGLQISHPYTLNGVTRITTRHYVAKGNPNAVAPYETWATAAADLQDALAIASSGDKIWVAAGTYQPTSGSDRDVSFELIDGVALYGGFLGNESSLAERDPGTNLTILSGDLAGDDGPNFANNGENSYHVVVANNASSATVLDGFIITSGNADHGSATNNNGGGLYLSNASLTISTCSFTANSAAVWGGAIYSEDSEPIFTNCSFSGNSAGTFGGAIYNETSSPSFTNCAFSGNAADSGGGIYHTGVCEPKTTNCSFSGNSASDFGGAILLGFNNTLTATNCLIWNNQDSSGVGSAGSAIFIFGGSATYSHCLIQGLNPGGTNLDGTLATNDPLFGSTVDPTTAPTTSGDLRLLSGSPAINAGDGAANSEFTDLAGNPRIVGTIDLGAYEGSFVSFALLHPTLVPGGDENLNGVSNYGDYAAGGNPNAPDDPSLRASLGGGQLTFSFRNNAIDVATEFQKSETLLPNSWSEMTKGIDYSVNASTVLGGKTIQTLGLLAPVADEDRMFFRQEFTSP
mgnify:CR=1 FL=1